MRIAVSGAHRTGKTTLVHALARALPGFVAVEEPYHLLEEEGHAFADPPSLEDFERQLERSIAAVLGEDEDRIFDRCPADVLAYLTTHHDADAFDADAWMPRVRDAMGRLDLVVFVPVEHPDRVKVSDPEDAAWRRRVDGELRDVLLADRRELGVEAVEVAGTLRERVRQVLARVSLPPPGTRPRRPA
jgi:predicted ATPase